MQTVTTIGLDIAKSVFQVHGDDAARPGGHLPPVEASLRRRILPEIVAMPIGIEACASSPHWSRELQALGHIGRLMAQLAGEPAWWRR